MNVAITKEIKWVHKMQKKAFKHELTSKNNGNKSEDPVTPVEERTTRMVGTTPSEGSQGLHQSENNGDDTELKSLFVIPGIQSKAYQSMDRRRTPV